MARLPAVAKALFYRTPPRIISLIADSVSISGKGSLLDLCAGEGDAAGVLAQHWGLRSYGIELHQGRAKKAATLMDEVLHGSYHQAEIKPPRPFSVLFLNPPYDEGVDASGKSMRQEVVFLEEAFKHIAYGGLVIFIPPEAILKNEAFQAMMKQQCLDIQGWRFPDPEYHDFKQVVVMARYASHHKYSYACGDISRLLKPLPILGELPYGEFTLPSVDPLESFELQGIPPESYAPSFEDPTAAWDSPKWRALTETMATTLEAPLVAPRAGHLAMLLAAGRLNGVEIEGSLVKGGSDKTIETISREGETIERERIVSHLSVLNLHTGNLDTWRVDEDIEKTEKWFVAHGDAIAHALLKSHTPLFDGDLSSYDFSKIKAPGVLPGKDKAELLPLQKEAAAAIVHRWKHHKSAILSGELGSGKTTMAIASCILAGHPKTVVICPTHLTKKWVRECEAITGVPGVAMIATSFADIDLFFQEDVPDDNSYGLFWMRKKNPVRYLILSKETAKLGCRWMPSSTFHWRIVSQEVIYRDSYGYQKSKTTRKRVKILTCPRCGVGQEITALDVKVKQSCKDCQEPLWQVVPLTAKGTKRWPLASYINLKYPRRFALVLDECHQFAKAESDQSKAVQTLATAATKILAMTGTLYGGRASSLFPLLYKVEASFRDLYQYKDGPKFVEHHGLFETVYPEDETTTTYGYRKGGAKTGGRIREIPGMSPAMIPLLLPFTVFVKLQDFGLDLPPYSETVELVDHDPDIRAAISQLGREARSVLRQYPEVLGQYLMACLGYPDFPEQEEDIVAPANETHGTVHIASAPAFPRRTLPKDQRVIDIALSEHAQARKCLVFLTQTHRRDARGRLKEALEAQGLRVVILDAKVSPIQREEWLRDADLQGFDVMLTNGRLVETGLDLLFAHTIIQYGVEYSVPTLRQSIRRSWRLGQTKPVKVFFLAYRDTMQDIATTLISKKMRASEMVDGDLVGGLAQHDTGGTNFLVELAHAVLMD